MKKEDLKYLRALSREFPNVSAAAAEIINLNAILNLPKGTEHFVTDIHGEYDQFQHIIRNGSGAIRRKLDEEFGPDIREEDKKQLAALIYYPKRKLEYVLKKEKNLEEWYHITIYRLVRVCKAAGVKYTRSKVRKAMTSEFSYIMEELLTGRPDISEQEAYYDEIIRSVIRTGRARELIVAFCNLIRRLVVDHLHVVGDIFDRGPSPHLIMDSLMEYHSLDIQWGNHDVLWMGAAAGSAACMANLIRISARYGNLAILEEAYGINLIPLAKLAMDTYKKVDSNIFKVRYREDDYDIKDEALDERMHKAITVIQLKLEGQLIKRRAEFDMNDRMILEHIDIKNNTVTIDGKEYELLYTDFPTINWKDPYKLSPDEDNVVKRLMQGFRNSERLHKHVNFLYSKGSLYKVFNGNLLFHGCVPMEPDGSFRKVKIAGKEYSGKALYDKLESYARQGYYSLKTKEKRYGEDILWYLWQAKDSPLFGKSKMATFERYFIKEKETHKEPKDYYYRLLENEDVINSIFAEFGLPAEGSHIVNGHVPVEVKAGESPVKCNGKLLVIDGGFSKAYQKKTGIAGYTLVYNSHGMFLAAHEPIQSIEKAIKEGTDIHSDSMIVNHLDKRKMVADTDVGKRLKETVYDLEKLLDAYRTGLMT